MSTYLLSSVLRDLQSWFAVNANVRAAWRMFLASWVSPPLPALGQTSPATSRSAGLADACQAVSLLVRTPDMTIQGHFGCSAM